MVYGAPEDYIFMSIQDIYYEDDGIYICTAENTAGKLEAQAQLIVRGNQHDQY